MIGAILAVTGDASSLGAPERNTPVMLEKASHAWDAIRPITMALRESGADSAKMRDSIEKTANFVGADGVFNFPPTDHSGLSKDAFVMVEIVDGKWTLQQ